MSARHGNKQKHESKNPIQRALIARFKRHAVRLARSIAPRTILDVGCGEGYMLEAFVEGGVTAELRGVDLSEQAVEDARARLGPRARVELQDARALVDLGETFELVMMLEVLEHIPEPGQMLPILDALATRHLLLSVPWEPFFRGLNLLRGKNVRRWGNDPEHVNHWGRADFLEFVGARFRVLETPFVFPWVMVLCERPG